MSALRRHVNIESRGSAGTPYPSWTAMADLTGSRAKLPAQDSRGAKEERIWRALAEEGDAEMTTPPTPDHRRR